MAALDRKSFGQSFGLPRATLGLKATTLAEVVIRASESSGTAMVISTKLDDVACEERNILHTIKTGTDWPLMAMMRSVVA